MHASLMRWAGRVLLRPASSVLVTALALSACSSSSGSSSPPAPVPSPSPTLLIPTVSCSTARAVAGSTYYALDVLGNVAAGGGALTAARGTWVLAQYAAGPSPVPSPSLSPTSSSVRPFYVYTGTYSVTSATAPTTGCFALLTTTDGSAIVDVGTSALGAGFVLPGSTGTVQQISAGSLTVLSLSVSPASGTGSGTFTLDDGDSGTIAITGVTTVQEPLERARRELRFSSLP